MVNERKSFSLVIYIGYFLLFLIADNIHASNEIPVENYKLVWSDEFDGDSLDMAKWGYRYLGERGDGVNVKNAVSLTGEGQLEIKISRVNGEIHTGMIHTQDIFMPTYGYFECRAKLPVYEGYNAAFWLQSPTIWGAAPPEESGTEVDIFEYSRVKGDIVQHNLHWGGYGDDHQTTGFEVTIKDFGVTRNWHTYGFLWTSKGYTFYIDGKKTWETSEAISKRDEFIVLSSEVKKWWGDVSKAKLPDTFVVDYVRVYQNIESSTE